MTLVQPREFSRLERSAGMGTLLAAVLLIVTGVITRQALSNSQLIPSLKWFDVAVVQVFCALPIAWWTGVWSATMRPGVRVVLVATAFVVVASLAVSATNPTTSSWLIESILLSTIVVLATSLCTVLVVGLSTPLSQIPFSAFTAVSLLMVAYVVPATCLHARLRNQVVLLTDLLDQSRFGEALETARPIARLQSQTEINGRPIDEVLRTLTRGVGVLEAQADAPIPFEAPDALLLSRARALAVLGRTDEAIAVLGICRDPGIEGLLLEGTIRETRGEWELGLKRYAEAKVALEKLAAGTNMTPQHIQAIRGVAYCTRKSGLTREAESAYQALLEVSPTADAHFLVAQFYEDAQETAKALSHAKQAMALDPQRFRESGRTLITRMQTMHFGCWGVYTSSPSDR